MGAEGSRPGGQGQGWNPGLRSLALFSPEAQTGPPLRGCGGIRAQRAGCIGMPGNGKFLPLTPLSSSRCLLRAPLGFSQRESISPKCLFSVGMKAELICWLSVRAGIIPYSLSATVN